MRRTIAVSVFVNLGVVLILFSALLAYGSQEVNEQNNLAEAEMIPSEQQVIYTDMIEAYEQGRLSDARELSRGHLVRFNTLMEKARNDSDLETAVRMSLGVIHSMLDAENRLKPTVRLGRSIELRQFVKSVLLQARSNSDRLQKASGSVKAFIKRELGYGARAWIQAGSAQIPRDELEGFYQDFQKELKAKGFANLDAVLMKKAPGPPVDKKFQLPSEEEIPQIIATIKDYFEGLVTNDPVRLARATGLNTQAVLKLLDRYNQDLQEEGVDTILRLTLPEISKEDLRLQALGRGMYSLMVRGIRLEIVHKDGTKGIRIIDKHFRLRRDKTGHWTIVRPNWEAK